MNTDKKDFPLKFNFRGTVITLAVLISISLSHPLLPNQISLAHECHQCRRCMSANGNRAI